MERCSHGKDAVEKAVREERKAVVHYLREIATWFNEMGRSPAGLLSDDHVSEEFYEEAYRIERGEHRK